MPLIPFYLELGTDSEGRSLSEILDYTDAQMEFRHDFIQWLFPTPEPSRYNLRAPILAREHIAAFHRDPVLRANLRRSFDRFLSFLGLAGQEKDNELVEGPNFDARQTDVWTHDNHNWRRITRVLASMSLLDCREDARLLYRWLRQFDHRYDRGKRKTSPFPPQTMSLWLEAVNRQVDVDAGADKWTPSFQRSGQLVGSQ